jgi:hypothetical protein
MSFQYFLLAFYQAQQLFKCQCILFLEENNTLALCLALSPIIPFICIYLSIYLSIYLLICSNEFLKYFSGSYLLCSIYTLLVMTTRMKTKNLIIIWMWWDLIHLPIVPEKWKELWREDNELSLLYHSYGEKGKKFCIVAWASAHTHGCSSFHRLGEWTNKSVSEWMEGRRESMF